jgi:hypothetical protein
MQMNLSHSFPSVFAESQLFSLPLFGDLSRSPGVYGIVVLSVGLAAFVGACLLVTTCKRPAVIAAYLPVVLFPLLVGVHGSVAMHYEFYDRLSKVSKIHDMSSLADDQAQSAYMLYLGVLATWPAFLVVAVGLFVRTLRYQGPSQKAKDPATEIPSKKLSG